MESAKLYWLRYFPLEEMPSLAAVVAEAYRNKLIDDNQALAAMKLSEKDINEWIKTNKKLNKEEN